MPMKSTLTDEQVDRIVEEYYTSCLSRHMIADKYGISQGLLKKVITQYNRRHNIKEQPELNTTVQADTIAHNYDASELTKENFPLLFQEINEDIDLTKFLPGSHKKVQWKCSTCGNIWNTEIRVRARKGCGCPRCNAGRVKKNKGYNDVDISKSIVTLYPEKMKYWSWEKNDVDPKTVAPSSALLAWWECPDCHHFEYIPVFNFIKRTTNCLECHKGSNSSFGEIFILNVCSHVFKDEQVISRDTSLGFEIDILIPNHKIGFEFCGWHWHEDKLEQDTEKIHQALHHGVTVTLFALFIYFW